MGVPYPPTRREAKLGTPVGLDQEVHCPVPASAGTGQCSDARLLAWSGTQGAALPTSREIFSKERRWPERRCSARQESRVFAG